MKEVLSSVIIPTYDNDLRLEWTMEGLCCQERSGFEVIVVNDGGESVTERLVQRFSRRLRIKYVFLGGRKRDSRSAAARNAGAKVSVGERLIFLDSDMVPDVDFIAAHTINADARSCFYGFRRHYPYSRVRRFEAPLDYADLERGSTPDRRLSGYSAWDNPQLYLHFLSCNYSVPADIFCSLGGHDERFEGWGEEDIDLGFRIEQVGGRIQPLWGLGCATHLDHPQRQVSSQARPWYLNRDEPLCRNEGPLVRASS